MLLDFHAERPAFLPNRWTQLGQFFQGIFESAVSGDWSRCPKTFLVAVDLSSDNWLQCKPDCNDCPVWSICAIDWWSPEGNMIITETYLNT